MPMRGTSTTVRNIHPDCQQHQLCAALCPNLEACPLYGTATQQQRMHLLLQAQQQLTHALAVPGTEGSTHQQFQRGLRSCLCPARSSLNAGHPDSMLHLPCYKQPGGSSSRQCAAPAPLEATRGSPSSQCAAPGRGWRLTWLTLPSSSPTKLFQPLLLNTWWCRKSWASHPARAPPCVSTSYHTVQLHGACL